MDMIRVPSAKRSSTFMANYYLMNKFLNELAYVGTFFNFPNFKPTSLLTTFPMILSETLAPWFSSISSLITEADFMQFSPFINFSADSMTYSSLALSERSF